MTTIFGSSALLHAFLCFGFVAGMQIGVRTSSVGERLGITAAATVLLYAITS